METISKEMFEKIFEKIEGLAHEEEIEVRKRAGGRPTISYLNENINFEIKDMIYENEKLYCDLNKQINFNIPEGRGKMEGTPGNLKSLLKEIESNLKDIKNKLQEKEANIFEEIWAEIKERVEEDKERIHLGQENNIEEVAQSIIKISKLKCFYGKYIKGDYTTASKLEKYFSSQNFHFSPHQISSFYTALKTKGFVILAGLSGTGKTKMAQIFTEGFNPIQLFLFNLIQPFLEKDKEISQNTENLIKEFKENYYEKIKQNKLTLEEWHSGKKGLLYELEFGKYGKKLGSIGGGSAEKFGIYYSPKEKIYKISSLIKTKDLKEAFSILLKELNELIQYAEKGDLESIENKIKSFWPIIKRKFTYIFNPQLIIPCYTEEDLKKILRLFGYEFKDFIDAQKKLKDIKKRIAPNIHNQTFGEFLYGEELKELWDRKIDEIVPLSEKFINSFFLSVRPDWRDSKSLIGYFNPIMNRFEDPTGFLKFILNAIIDYKSNGQNASPYFVILDEMNLARVEYYFAEFLSVLESGRDENGFTKEGIKIQISGEEIKEEKEEQKGLLDLIKKAEVEPVGNIINLKLQKRKEIKIKKKKGAENIINLKLPPNLYFIGTVNIDETTFMFSPKVLDRAFTIEFKEVDFDKYKEILGGETSGVIFDENIIEDFTQNGEFLKAYSDKSKIKEAINELKEDYFSYLKNLSKILEPYNLHFAYRVLDEIALFYKNAKEAKDKGIISFKDDDEIIDLAVLMKVLPKFHGNIAKLEEPLLKVLYWCKNSDKEEDIENIKNNYKDIKKILEEIEKLKMQVKESKSSSQPSSAQTSEQTAEQTSKENKTPDYKFPHTALKTLEMLYKLYTENYASYL